MDKAETQAAEVLKDLQPKSKAAKFAKAWPAIKQAIDQGFTLQEIHAQLRTGNVLDVHYITFTRMVKNKQAAESGMPPAPAVTPAKPSTPSSAAASNAPASALVDRTIQSSGDDQGASAADGEAADKANQIYSQAGSALEEARSRVAKTDYSKLARQAERDSKK